jgi:peptidyl-tRNA hydrolase, PTH1 family
VIYHFRRNREFCRLRIGVFCFLHSDLFSFSEQIFIVTYAGIGRPPGQMDPKAFVLQKFNRTGRERVNILILKVQ